MNLIKPSFSTGYAKNASESANPNLWKGLVGAWMPSFGVTGNTLKDVSGNGNDGTLTNMDAASDWVATSKGLAIRTEADQRIICDGKATDLPMSGSFTAGVLVNNVSTDYPDGALISKASESSPHGTAFAGWILYMNSSGNLRAYWRGAFRSGSVAIVLSQKKWLSIFMRYDAASDEGNIIVNGENKLTFTTSVTPLASFQDIRIADYKTNSVVRNVNANYAVAWVYDRALSDSEIKQLYLNPAAPFERKQQTVGISTAAAVPSANFNPFSVLTHPLEQ